MKKQTTTPTTEREILYFDEPRFVFIKSSAKSICDQTNKALALFYRNLNQPKLEDATIIPTLLTGTGKEALFADLIRRNQEKKHPETDQALNVLVSESLLKTDEFKLFVSLINAVNNSNSPFPFGAPDIEFYFFDENGLLMFDAERAKIEKFTTYIDTPGKAKFIKVAESVANGINELYQMQTDAGTFNYRTDIGEFFSRLQEIIIIQDEKAIFDRSYLFNTNL